MLGTADTTQQIGISVTILHHVCAHHVLGDEKTIKVERAGDSDDDIGATVSLPACLPAS